MAGESAFTEATESSRLANFPNRRSETVRGTARQGVKGAVGRLFQRLADGLQHQLLHDDIGVGVGVAAVGTEARQHLRRGLPADASAAVEVNGRLRITFLHLKNHRTMSGY